jgi:hypothetical protein
MDNVGQIALPGKINTVSLDGNRSIFMQRGGINEVNSFF